MSQTDHISRVVAFGDSVTNGLGARGREFPVVVAERLEVPLLNLSGTALMVNESAQVRHNCRSEDLVLIMHGIVEAIPRVPETRLRWLPERWAGPGRMDPRPYFATSLAKRTLQRLDSALRWRLKCLLIRRGAVAMMGPKDFADHLRLLVSSAAGVAAHVMVIAGSQIDDRFYPGAAAALRDYAQLSQSVARVEGVLYVDITHGLHRWDDFLADRFHPSADGHAKIAQLILDVLEAPAAG